MRTQTVTRITALLVTAGVLAGCGSSQTAGSADTAGSTGEYAAVQASTADAAAAVSEEEAYAKEAKEAAGKDDGQTLNIYSMNGTFRDRLRDYYPGYEDSGDGSGTIGNVKVNWYIASDSDTDYDDMLSEALDQKEEASQDSRIDLFLVDADEAGTYTDSDDTLNLIDDIGMTREELSDQYSYTQTLGSDRDGNLKAVTWQADPGVLVYRRSIAKDVLGSDDPETVQEAVSGWDAFADTAAKMKDKDYVMLSGNEDTYRAYAGAMSGSWVQDGEIVVDSSLSAWAAQMKDFVDKDYTNGHTIWSDEWYDDQKSDGKVFCFFLPPWGVEYTLDDSGDYAVCRGPQAWHWGEELLFAASGTDNPHLIRDILEKMTCHADIMTQMTSDAKEFTNTKSGMRTLADQGVTSEKAGGQNCMQVYCDQAEAVRAVTPTQYDTGLNSLYRAAMESYFDGDLDRDEALKMFGKAAVQKYDALTFPDSGDDDGSTEDSSSQDTE